MQITIDQYVHYREHGFLVVPALIAPHEVRELLDHVDDLLAGGADVLRIHMLHRRLEIHERYMLHPEILDVVAALVGPDVLALQTMLFVKRPGSPGQGYHQDSFHIITQPDTLIGAWVALDRADSENGCLWITAGSQNEPIYPDADPHSGHGGDRLLADIPEITGADDPDESRNGLTLAAASLPPDRFQRPRDLERQGFVRLGSRRIPAEPTRSLEIAPDRLARAARRPLNCRSRLSAVDPPEDVQNLPHFHLPVRHPCTSTVQSLAGDGLGSGVRSSRGVGHPS